MQLKYIQLKNYGKKNIHILLNLGLMVIIKKDIKKLIYYKGMLILLIKIL